MPNNKSLTKKDKLVKKIIKKIRFEIYQENLKYSIRDNNDLSDDEIMWRAFIITLTYKLSVRVEHNFLYKIPEKRLTIMDYDAFKILSRIKFAMNKDPYYKYHMDMIFTKEFFNSELFIDKYIETHIGMH